MQHTPFEPLALLVIASETGTSIQIGDQSWISMMCITSPEERKAITIAEWLIREHGIGRKLVRTKH